MSLRIRQFQPSDQPAVKKLILNGLVDHWKILDPTKNPDLDDIYASYQHATFVVAQENDCIIGCGALVPHTAETVEIVRMSVESNFRRKGIGTLILQHLIQEARMQGYRTIILETTATWQEVIAFYLRSGFHITHYKDGDAYFALNIADYTNT